MSAPSLNLVVAAGGLLLACGLDLSAVRRSAQ